MNSQRAKDLARSSLAKDLEAYAQANIPKYWVVNLINHREIVVHSPKNGDYSTQYEIEAGGITSQVAPEVTIAVSTLVGALTQT